MSEEHHTTLGEIAYLRIGRTPPRKDPTYWTDDLTHPFLSIGDMTGRVLDTTSEGVTQAALDNNKARLVPAGALLMSFKLTIGRIAFAARPMCTNEAIVWIDPKDEADTDAAFLALALEAADLTAGQSPAVKGATLNKQSLSAIRLRIPSRDVQYRMVDLVDHLDRAIASADGVVEATHRALRDVRDHLLAEARTPLRELIDGFVAGKSPSAHDRLPEVGERAVLKVSAVRPGYFDALEVKTLDPGIEMPAKARLRSGDLLISRANTPERVGDVCMVDDAPPDHFLCDKTLRIVPKEGVQPAFLLHALQTSAVRELYSTTATGTSASMVNLSQAKMEAALVPDLTPEERQHVVGALEPLDQLARRARTHVRRLQDARGALVGSLMSGAHTIPDSYDRFLTDVAEVA